MSRTTPDPTVAALQRASALCDLGRYAEAAAEALRKAAATSYTVACGGATPEQVEAWTQATKNAKASRDAYLELAQQELGSA